MPRFFFHLEGSVPVQDVVGEWHPNNEQALVAAMNVARKLTDGMLILESEERRTIAELRLGSVQTEAESGAHSRSAGTN